MASKGGPCIYMTGLIGLPNAWVNSSGGPCYPEPGYSNGIGVSQPPNPTGYITDPNPPPRTGSTTPLPQVNGNGNPLPTSPSSGGGIGKTALAFVGGVVGLIFLGGTRFAPVVVAFLVATLIYWALNPFKSSSSVKGG